MKTSLVSVVIPLFNQERYIEAALLSALNQTYQNIEIIIVDDGSSDRSAEIVKRYTDPRIHYYYQKNSGLPAVARNQGIKLAKGEWVAFLDSDDVWLPTKLELQIKAVNENPEVKLVAGDMIYWDGRPERKWMVYKQKSLDIFIDMIEKNRILTSTVLINKAVLAEMKGFRENPDLLAIEDYDLWIRVSKKYKVKYLDHILAKYRVSSNSISGGRFKELARLENYQDKYLFQFVGTAAEKKAYKISKSRLYFLYVLAYLDIGDHRYKNYLRKLLSIDAHRLIKPLIWLIYFCPENCLYLFQKSIKAIWRYSRGHKPKMLILFWGVPSGGGDTYLRNLLPGLISQYDVVLASTNPQKNLGCAQAKNYYVPFENWKSGAWMLYLIRIVVKEQISIIFTQEIILSVICRYLKVLFPRLKYFSAIHSDIRCYNKYSSSFIKKLLLINKLTSFLVDKFICVSEYLAKNYLFAEGIPNNKIEVIYSGAPSSPNENIPAPTKDDALWKVGFIGRFNYDKGFDVFVEVAKRIIRSQKGYQFHAAGEGDYYINEARAMEVGFPENFKLHGYIENVGEYYRQMDCIVVPSRTEGFCYILIEAFHYGVPLVCTNVGAIPEIVGNDAAVICPTEDVDALVRGIIKLRQDKFFRSQLIERASAREGAFSLGEMQNRYVNAFQASKITRFTPIKKYILLVRIRKGISRLVARLCLLYSRIIKPSGLVTVLTYHKIIPSLDNIVSINSYVSISAFKSQIEYLLRKGFKFLSIEEFHELIKNKTPLTHNSVLLTFDDGSQDNYMYVFPILKQYELPAVFFVSTKYIGSNKSFWWDRLEALLQNTVRNNLVLEINKKKIMISLNDKLEKAQAFHSISDLLFGAGELIKSEDDVEAVFRALGPVLCSKEYVFPPSAMNWDAITEIHKAGFKIGAHTSSHCSLLAVDEENAYAEIAQSKNILQEKLGENVWFFSYPYGHYNASIKKMIKDLDFRLAFCSQEGHVNLKKPPYEIERVSIGGQVDMLLFKAKMTRYYQKIINKLYFLEGLISLCRLK